MLEWLVEWWDGVELWLVQVPYVLQLPYPLQVALVFAVLLPVCWGLARVIDHGIDGLIARLTWVRDAEPPLGNREGAESREDLA